MARSNARVCLAAILLAFSTGSAAIDTAWVRRYSALSNVQEKAYATVAGESGSVYVAGTSDSSARLHYVTMKYAATGNLSWVVHDTGKATLNEQAVIARDSAGSVYLAGTVDEGAYTNCVILKYNPQGTRLWRALFGAGDAWSQGASAIAADHEGGVCVAGHVDALDPDSLPYLKFLVVKYDSQGNWLWTYVTQGSSDGDNEALSVAVDQSNNVYAAGYTYTDNNDDDYCTVKLRGDGSLGWKETYDVSDDMAEVIAVADSNAIFVTGESDEATGHGWDYLTVKYDHGGDTVWTARYDGPGHGNDLPSAMAVDSSGNVIVTGNSTGGGSGLDIATVKYSSQGNTVFGVRLDTSSSDGAAGLGVDRFNNVYVVGSCSPGSTPDYLAVRYDSNGVRVWLKTYNGPANGDDRAAGIVVLDRDTVYVAGTSNGDSTGPDISTLKYVFTPSMDVALYSIDPLPPYVVVQTPTEFSCDVWNNYTQAIIFYMVRVAVRDTSGREVYYDTMPVQDHQPQSLRHVHFPDAWTPTAVGQYTVRCSTMLADDADPSNDAQSASLEVVKYALGWRAMDPLPLGPKHKNVKDGGALAFAVLPGNDTGFIYAFKGNYTYEFYRYNSGTNAWTTRESIPTYNRLGKKKAPKKGASLAFGANGKVYATKGNYTLDLWEYDPQIGAWTQKADVPAGAKPCKEGVGTVAVSEGNANHVYLLKGSNTYEFYRYSVDDNTWQAMPNAPAGASGRPFKNGSCLAYDGGDTIYCLKGSYNELFVYSISGNHWETRDTVPKVYPRPGNRKRTKVKDGAGLAYLDGTVYALKGHNTNELWSYECDKHKWYASDTMPTGLRKVRGGGGLVAGDGVLWAFRGNNTREFFAYNPTGMAEPPGTYNPVAADANEVQIAAFANPTAETPTWSNDGAWVAFCHTNQGNVTLYKSPANGGQETALTSVSSDCSNPVWSPDGATIAFEYEASASEYTQIAIVDSGGGQVTVLTSDACDHENPSWSLDGSGLFYTRPDAGYTQVYYVSTSGGSEQAKSTSSYDHEMPGVLSSTEVVCQRDGDDVYGGIYRLNVGTGQEVALTSGSADYSNPSVAVGARLIACEKTDQDGYSQIVVFSADGGAETVVTSGSYDFESPSICYDGSVVSCVRIGSSGSAVCVIDLLEGTCQTFTDALADRESPDAHALSSAQNLVSTAYIREGDVYKVDYLSSSGMVIAPNGFRAGIARDPNGYVHSVYSDGTLIRHKVQDQTGTCIRQDTPGYGDCPSLSMSIAGDAVVVCRKGDSIFGAVQRANNSWKRVLLYSAPASHHVGPPSSAAFQVVSGRFINACVPCYDSSGPGSSMILFMQADTVSGNVVLDTLDLCTGSCADSSVCMAVNSATSAIEASYQRSESIFYRSVHFSPTDSMRPIPWTGPSRVNDSATTGRNPTCERLNGRFYVAFSEHWIDSASSNPVWSIVRASCCDTVPVVTWEGRGPVSSVDSIRKDRASLSLTRVAWVESSNTTHLWLIRANIADSQLTLSPDTSCVSCALLCDSTVLSGPATAMTRLRLVWLQKYGGNGDTWQVPSVEREIYASSADANVTRYNQGRKLCLDSTGSSTDSIRVVFRSNQSSLWIARKRDGDETWNSSLLRSTGDMPAIDQSQGRIWCCCRDVSTVPPGNVIRCQNRAIGSTTWHDFQVYFTNNPTPANSRLGPPAIVASLNDTSGQNRGAAYIIFTAYTPTPPKSAVVMIKVDTAGNVLWTDTLHSVSSLTDSFADVAAHSVTGQGYGLHATWGQGGTVQYRKSTNLDQPEFTLKRVWSTSYSVGSGTNLRHPVIAASAETVLVAYVAGDSGRIMTRGQAPSSNYNVWDDTVNVSQCPDTVADWPSITPLAPGESTVVSYQKRLSSTNYDVMARVNFHGSINLSNTAGANSKYPHVAFHLHNDSFPVVTAIWTEGQGATTAEVGYKRWQLGLDGGGGIQDFSIFDPNIRPSLFAPAPNPFNGLARIHFQTNIRGMTKVSVMDITGRRVRNLLCMPMKPGVYNLTWNARDDRERKLAGGVYFVRLETPNYHETRKVVLTE